MRQHQPKEMVAPLLSFSIDEGFRLGRETFRNQQPVRKRNLGGFFVWAIGGPGYSDYDGHSEDLLTAMSKAFRKYGTLPAKQATASAASVSSSPHP